MGRGRAPCCEKIGLNKGSWTPAEDMRLVAYIQKFGHGNWRALPKQAGLLRCGKSCRLRWINYLRPDIKRGNFSKDEEDTIIKLHSLLGNKWSKIASCLPGRTDNEIKNVWNTHLKKRVVSTKQQNIDSSNDQQSDVEIKTSNNINAKIPETQTIDSSDNQSGESKDASEEKIEIVIEPISLDMSTFMLDDEDGDFFISPSSSNESYSTNTNNKDQDQDPLWSIMDEEYPDFMLGDCEEQTNYNPTTTTLGEESSCSEDESKRWLANLEKELDLDLWGDEDNLQQSLSDPVSCYFQRAL
ncbi:hypothetical protein J5N97_018808 [Dioscorea zingiberensis]|uniref:Uncharacterized protein n=1 Tax=Dioscorea zingiberensis TaxID=325984 RepID=A0A9D5HBU9_9LILI|nr:hypothetical protein J5N97_018808 [Dioscorea zingiberensis]